MLSEMNKESCGVVDHDGDFLYICDNLHARNRVSDWYLANRPNIPTRINSDSTRWIARQVINAVLQSAFYLIGLEYRAMLYHFIARREERSSLLLINGKQGKHVIRLLNVP